jgi:hypothetical protein
MVATNTVHNHSQSYITTRLVGQAVLVSIPFWGLGSDSCYYQTVAVLSMWGVLSDERAGPYFTAVKISSTCHLYLQFYMSALYTLICERSRFLVYTNYLQIDIYIHT